MPVSPISLKLPDHHTHHPVDKISVQFDVLHEKIVSIMLIYSLMDGNPLSNSINLWLLLHLFGINVWFLHIHAGLMNI